MLKTSVEPFSISTPNPSGSMPLSAPSAMQPSICPSVSAPAAALPSEIPTGPLGGMTKPHMWWTTPSVPVLNSQPRTQVSSCTASVSGAKKLMLRS